MKKKTLVGRGLQTASYNSVNIQTLIFFTLQLRSLIYHRAVRENRLQSPCHDISIDKVIGKTVTRSRTNNNTVKQDKIGKSEETGVEMITSIGGIGVIRGITETGVTITIGGAARIAMDTRDQITGVEGIMQSRTRPSDRRGRTMAKAPSAAMTMANRSHRTSPLINRIRTTINDVQNARLANVETLARIPSRSSSSSNNRNPSSGTIR